MKFLVVSLNAIFLCLSLSCSKSSDAVSNPETKTPAPTEGSNKPDEVAVMPCPWNFQSSKTLSNYQAIGVSLQMDCKKLAGDSNFSYQYTQDDLTKTLEALDSSFEVISHANHKPTVISLGKGSFHDSKNNLIQVTLGGVFAGPNDEFSHFMDVTMKLMEIEKSDFKSEVRFS